MRPEFVLEKLREKVPNFGEYQVVELEDGYTVIFMDRSELLEISYGGGESFNKEVNVLRFSQWSYPDDGSVVEKYQVITEYEDFFVPGWFIERLKDELR